MSRIVRLVVALALLIGVIGSNGARPQAQGPQAVFHAGITGGIVRDATKIDSTIYGVGTWANSGAGGRIDGALWTIVTGSAVSQTPLPVNVTVCADPGVTCNSTQNLAAGNAITPDAAYIASQARSTTPTTAVKVTNAGGVLSNLDLTPTSSFSTTGSTIGAVYNGGGRAASAISDDGSVLYGQLNVWLGQLNQNGSKAFQSRVYRFDVPAATAVQVYSQPATVTKTVIDPADGLPKSGPWQIDQSMLARGASSGGSIAVGTTFTNAPVPDSQAFRYDSAGAGSVVLIPRAPGGLSNAPIALSNDGNLTALIGDSTAYPKGEVYLYNATTTARTYLGSPNSAMSLQAIGGISDDGSVVALSTVVPCQNPCNPQRYGYFHNSHGWFHLMSALADAGVGLTNWQDLNVQGMNGNATMVWGSGLNGSAQEGFVAEFPADYLANYNPVATPPANSSIVGVWALDDYPVDPAAPAGVLAFMADGSYYDIEPDGFERGLYTFDGTTARFWTMVDANGTSGVSGENGRSRAVSVVGDELVTPPGCQPDVDPDCGVLRRITSPAGSLVGGWVSGDSTQNDSSAIVAFTSSGKYFMAQDGVADNGGHDGIEIGTATWSLSGGVFTLTSKTIVTDTNGDWGLSDPIGPITAALTADELGLNAGDSAGTSLFTRIIDPATVAQVTGGSAEGTLGVPFTYQVSALRAQGYGATGLPSGLGIDGTTGEISGTPAEVGFFPVTVFAGNTFGTPRTATVNLTIASAAPTAIGTDVTVTPVVPDGTPEVTLTFDQVAEAGETTVAVLDPDVTPTELPSGFQFGDPPQYYQIETSAVLAPGTSVTMCFSYAGIDFGGNTPRLFHYVNGAWVDITTSVDTATQTLCGSTSSFSPFAIFASSKTFQKGLGFYEPVSPLAGFVNTVKAGSTVPLKFNVTVNGIEKTDVSGLAFSTTTVACTVAPEDPVDYVTVDSTNLRWAGDQFILNWKTPKTPGCYIARVTSPDGSGGSVVLVSATFKLK